MPSAYNILSNPITSYHQVPFDRISEVEIPSEFGDRPSKAASLNSPVPSAYLIAGGETRKSSVTTVTHPLTVRDLPTLFETAEEPVKPVTPLKSPVRFHKHKN